MSADSFALAAFIILLLPMFYFFMTSPTFLLVRLDVEQVTRLMRGHFSGYFVVLGIAGVMGTIAFAAAGRPVMTAAIAAITAFAFAARVWFLRQMDAQIRARDAGDAEAVRRLRRLHWGGMLCNTAQVVPMVASIPYVFGTMG